RAMAEGPTHLLEVCSQKLSEFLCNVHRRLAWLREIEEEAMKMFDSNLSVEPELMPKTPSQKKHRRKKRSSYLKDESSELTRKRLSRRRRSSIKPASSKQVPHRLQSKEKQEEPSDEGNEASAPCCTARICSKAEELPAPSEAVAEKPDILLVEGQGPLMGISVNDCCGADLHLTGNRPEIIDQPLDIISPSVDDQVPEKREDTELQPVSTACVLVISDTPGAKGTREDQDAPNFSIANTSTPKAAVDGEPAAEEDVSAQGPEKEFFQDVKDSTGNSTGSKSSHRSACRSQMGRSHKHRRTSLAEKYSLASKRERMIRKSISRAVSKKAAAQVSSSASSTVSCKFVESEGEFCVGQEWCFLCWVTVRTLYSFRRQSYKQAVEELCDGQRLGVISPSCDKTTSSPVNKALFSPSPASKVVRPFKQFLQTVQRNELLVSPGSTGHNSVMKNLIKRNTPTRPDLKEKERQRLESLRKKQEAEQQRKQKVEEEKRRRQEEMKLKREERLRKALQARERVEQMEEEKKKRMEQKLSQTEEKSEKVRGSIWKQSPLDQLGFLIAMNSESSRNSDGLLDCHRCGLALLSQEEDEYKQQELMQKSVEDEQQDKGRKIAELKRLAEQHQVEQKSHISDSYRGPQSGPKDPRVNPNNYGLDLNSDDSTDDESQPRKPVPVWATGARLNQAVTYQYYNPPNIDSLFGLIISPKLEDIFYKNKPRYFKRTSSAVWQSPPLPSTKSTLGLPYNLKKY
uniref:Inner centromere protein n=1 Tax=Pelusios castaneus TaxID=367368 RepID=A0A8C8RXF0_9SAUR